MNINKIAQKDAHDWARAEMFFGEGAGTRRKLLHAEISEKRSRVPGYEEKFDKAYRGENMADHAIKAAKERKRLDREAVVGKNVRALARGDHRNMSTGLMIVAGAVYVANQTGYDKKIVAVGKQAFAEARHKVDVYRYNRRVKKSNLSVVDDQSSN